MRKIVIVLLVLPFAAEAVPIEAGLFAQNRLRQCSGESSCIGGDPTIEVAADSAIGTDASVSARVIGPTFGTQSAISAGYAGDAYTPTISAYAYTSGPVRYTLGVFGLQRYEFIQDGEVTIDGTLTLSQSGQAQPSSQNPGGVMDATFMAFQMANDIFDPENCNLYNSFSGPGAVNEAGFINTCLRFDGQDWIGIDVEFSGLMNYQESIFDIGEGPITDGSIGGGINNRLTVSGGAGDVFFLGVSLGGGAQLGGFWDSRNTLTLDIDQPELVDAAIQVQSFRPAPARIPEPGTVALFGIGLLGLGMARRREKT